MSRFSNRTGKTIKTTYVNGKRRATIFEPIFVEKNMAKHFKEVARNYGMTYTELLEALTGYNNANGEPNGKFLEVPQYLDNLLKDFLNSEGVFG